jgi:hypothetical protein
VGPPDPAVLITPADVAAEAPQVAPLQQAPPPPPRSRRPARVQSAGPVDLDFGQVVVPFAGDPTRARTMASLARQRRMIDAERDLVRQGVTVQGAAPGVSARYGPGPVTLDAAALAPSLRGEPQLAVPDLALRAGIGPSSRREDGLSVGVSGWAGAGGADCAAAVDAGLRSGPWEVRASAEWQRTVRGREMFDVASARRVRGDAVSLNVRRTLRPGWTVDGESEARVFVAERTSAVVAHPWIRTAVGLTADPPGPVRWTLIEVAAAEVLGAATLDLARVSTRFDLARWR